MNTVAMIVGYIILAIGGIGGALWLGFWLMVMALRTLGLYWKVWNAIRYIYSEDKGIDA